MSSLRLFVALSCAILPMAGCHAADRSNASALADSQIRREPLVIATASGPRRFMVEIARTPEEQQKGLMFRTALDKDQGMIFPMLPPRDASFWMKNTRIPLDMIFIRPDGIIARIEENTVPESLDVIQSGEAVIAVLEIPGGQSEAQGIRAGDKVTLPF